jgi:hypothetical protein
MQQYLGLKPKRTCEAAGPGAVARAPTANFCASVPDEDVDRAIDLLQEEFYSSGPQLKHIFTSAQVLHLFFSFSFTYHLHSLFSLRSIPLHLALQVYSIVSDRSVADRALQLMVMEGSLRRFRNIGTRYGDDDFHMRNVNYIAALDRWSTHSALYARTYSL